MCGEGHLSYNEQSRKRHGGKNRLECAEAFGEFVLAEADGLCKEEEAHEARRPHGSIRAHPRIHLNRNLQLVAHLLTLSYIEELLFSDFFFHSS